MRFLAILAMMIVLAGCTQHRTHPDNFYPYLNAHRNSIPMAYGDEACVYPDGTPSADIIASWKEAKLVMSVYRPKTKGVLNVDLGPNFYSLSPAEQRGLAHAIAQIYGVGQKDKGGVYMVRDALTQKVIGSYTQYGLQFY